MSLIVAWTIESPLMWTPVAPLFKKPSTALVSSSESSPIAFGSPYVSYPFG